MTDKIDPCAGTCTPGIVCKSPQCTRLTYKQQHNDDVRFRQFYVTSPTRQEPTSSEIGSAVRFAWFAGLAAGRSPSSSNTRPSAYSVSATVAGLPFAYPPVATFEMASDHAKLIDAKYGPVVVALYDEATTVSHKCTTARLRELFEKGKPWISPNRVAVWSESLGEYVAVGEENMAASHTQRSWETFRDTASLIEQEHNIKD